MPHVFVQIDDTQQQFEQPGPLVGVQQVVLLGQGFDGKVHLRKQPIERNRVRISFRVDALGDFSEALERHFQIVVDAQSFLLEPGEDREFASLMPTDLTRIGCHFKPCHLAIDGKKGARLLP